MSPRSKIIFPNHPWNNVWYKYGVSGTEAGRIVYQQDATGVQQFHYDLMGNVDTNWHTYVQPHLSRTLSLKTAWRYDSWGRVQNITYPDREKVDYKYDFGGLLYSIDGYKSGHVGHTLYIREILYDHFGQRIQVVDGDDVKTTYTYDAASRRLIHLRDSSYVTGVLLQDNTYRYDPVGNIISIQDSGRNHRVQTYKYDDANRLIGSDGSIMQEHSTAQPYGYAANYMYSPAGRFLNKYVDSKRLSTAMGLHSVRYKNEYFYYHPDNPYAITHIQDAYGAHYDFGWDANGNLVNSHAHATHTDRRLCWTEDNRLQAYMERGEEGGIAAYYNYTADGERNIKFTWPRLNIQQNASQFNNPPLLFPTLYASPLITLTPKGYTKHYFEEGRRVCSKLGGGMRGNVTEEEIDSRVPELAYNYDDQFRHQYDGIRQTFHDCIVADPQIIDGVNLHQMLVDREVRRDEEEPAFFYHSDHLGSAAYLTSGGYVTQTLNYLPYGEDWIDVQNNMDPRLGIYRFNGKEKDYESGFHYYGARYYWSELLTGWLSVDPMMDKYPSLSPYNYCMWNPIKVVDPNGMDTSICYTQTSDNQKTMNYARRHYSYNRPDLLHYCAHGTTNNMYPFGYEENPDETANSMHNHVKDGGTKYNIIVLHSCDVGKGKGCFAEVLSNQLPDVLIFAPSDKLAVSDKYDKEYVMNNGSWNVYYGGKLVNTCPGSHEDTKALQFIWKNIPTQEIIEQFTQPRVLPISPIIIESNYIQVTLKKMHSH